MNNKSFTLIELLVVIVIIGILAGVIMISTSSSIDKANIAKSKVFSESVKNDLMLNLISEWKFNGDVLDDWNSVATTNSGITFLSNEECIDSECGFFDGTEFLSVAGGTISFPNNVFTLSFWVNTDKNNQIISNGSGCLFSLGSGDFTNTPSNQKGIYLAVGCVMHSEL